MESRQLHETIEFWKKKSKAGEEELLSLHQKQEWAKTKSYEKGVSDGILQTTTKAQAAKQPTIHLPKELDAKTVSEFIKTAFRMVAPRRHTATFSEIVADAALHHLYDGQCKFLLKESLKTEIMKDNPYRQAEEIAKVMDLSPGQLNLSGYTELRYGLEEKNEKGKIPRGGGWLCRPHYLKEAQKAIQAAAKVEVPYQMLPEID